MRKGDDAHDNEDEEKWSTVPQEPPKPVSDERGITDIDGDPAVEEVARLLRNGDVPPTRLQELATAISDVAVEMRTFGAVGSFAGAPLGYVIASNPIFGTVAGAFVGLGFGAIIHKARG